MVREELSPVRMWGRALPTEGHPGVESGEDRARASKRHPMSSENRGRHAGLDMSELIGVTKVLWLPGGERVAEGERGAGDQGCAGDGCRERGSRQGWGSGSAVPSGRGALG